MEKKPELIFKVKSDSLENTCLEMSPKIGKSFYVICWYRLSNDVEMSTFEKIREVIQKPEQDGKEIIIIGN